MIYYHRRNITINQIIVTLSQTLQLEGHENIFAMGDCADLPIQRSMIANMYQTRVGIHNMLSYLKGQSYTGIYRGESKISMFSGVQKTTVFYSKEGQDSVSTGGTIPEFLNFKIYKGLKIKKEKKMYDGKGSPVSFYEAKLNNKFGAGEQIRPAVYEEEH